MPILMKHELHGFHNVYSELEQKEHEKIGWKCVEAEKPAEIEKPAPVEKKETKKNSKVK